MEEHLCIHLLLYNLNINNTIVVRLSFFFVSIRDDNEASEAVLAWRPTDKCLSGADMQLR